MPKVRITGYASSRAASTGVGRKGGWRVGGEDEVLDVVSLAVLPFGRSEEEDILDLARVLDAGESIARAFAS